MKLNKGSDSVNNLLTDNDKNTGLRPSDVSELIGCSEYTVRKLVREGILPHYKVGSKIYFKRDSILKWIDKQEYKYSHYRY